MTAAPARYVSVSELYSNDEVALLLDEIRDLEPTSCRGEDVQDFEIAGSGVVCGGGAGGRSPCGTELTEHSWDSHAVYARGEAPPARCVAPLYCAWRGAGWRGAALLLLAACGGGAAACVWAAAGRQRLPLQARVQLLQLGALTTLTTHGALLLLQVTRLHKLLPLRWHALALLLHAWSCCTLGAGGLATLHAVLLAPAYRWAPVHLARLLLVAAALGVCGCALAALLLATGLRCAPPRYAAVPPPPPPPGGVDTSDHAL